MKEHCKGVHRIGGGCNLTESCDYPKCREDIKSPNYINVCDGCKRAKGSDSVYTCSCGAILNDIFNKT